MLYPCSPHAVFIGAGDHHVYFFSLVCAVYPAGNVGGGVAAAVILHHDGYGLPDQGLMEGKGVLFAYLDQLPCAFFLYGAGQLMGKIGCFGARAAAVGENVQPGKGNLLTEANGLLKVLFRFAGKAADHIGRKRAAREISS